MNIEQICILLFLSSLVAIACRRIRIPYTIGLTLAGFGLAFLPKLTRITLTKELIFTALLPPLIFEAALQIKWNELKQHLAAIATMATLGIALSGVIVFAGLHFGLGWQPIPALIVAVLISATDPVSVIALMKEAGIGGVRRLLLETESLLNDGTVAVLFALLLAVVGGESISASAAVLDFFKIVVGGVVCGGVIAGSALLISSRTSDHLVELLLTSISAFASFLLAEHFHVSGVLSTLTCGVILGNFGAVSLLSERARESLDAFWEFLAFIANSLVFLLIGMRLAVEDFSAVWLAMAVVIILSIAGRALAVYGCGALLSKSRFKVELNNLHLLFVGGLRGALALALVLSLPSETPMLAQILTITFGTVAFSVVAQGLLAGRILQRSHPENAS